MFLFESKPRVTEHPPEDMLVIIQLIVQ